MFELTPTVNQLPSLATEYIGSKRSLLDFITRTVVELSGDGPREIVDLFSGTGIVSAAFKALGYSVTANDHLATCFTLTAAALLNHDEPTFAGLTTQVDGLQTTRRPYQRVLDYLNNLSPVPLGFIHKHYSPASYAESRVERRYFTEANAQRIDTVRDTIEAWKPLLSEAEHALLISDLVRAASAVSNVAGTFGCYLKQWKPRALAPLTLTPNRFIDGRRDGHAIWSLEAHEAVVRSRARIIYADPPYTKRQYAAYYHILETIVRNDSPLLSGTTGLRNWETHASDFCYKRRAVGALRRVLDAMQCEHFFLSYNEDGQMTHDDIMDLLKEYGRVSFRELSLRRYRSSALPHKGPIVAERIYHLSVT
ncbi:DNA adenine methylase [Caballeronia sp. ATUFL_M2_KS44]|uniref:DNA adenine methylase n=1 Tax=Caballeronia sp. ATUFL_M2_KS44 TaxID=2921767 RepID=UPI002541C9FF|nr:DNA adenine methylase [Caballeronia sp. ATUFL_M2_KS44]